MTTVRTQRMIDTAPYYYQFSRVYEAIQAAPAAEYDSLEAKLEDLQAQLFIPTATWGLLHWETTLGIPVVNTDSYDIRRSRVLSYWRGFGSFSAKLIENVAAAYTNGEVDVSINIPGQEVTIQFIGTLGSPPNIMDLQALIDNIVHAHLSVTYKYKYLTISQVHNVLTITQLQARKLTDFAPFIPVV